MNLKYKTAALFIACTLSYQLYAQRPTIIKQPPKINGVLKATANANLNAKIHANSNSVFGTSSNHPNYDKKKQQKKGEIKNDEETKKNSKGKKQKS